MSPPEFPAFSERCASCEAPRIECNAVWLMERDGPSDPWEAVVIPHHKTGDPVWVQLLVNPDDFAAEAEVGSWGRLPGGPVDERAAPGDPDLEKAVYCDRCFMDYLDEIEEEDDA